jgi:hypothetical protein
MEKRLEIGICNSLGRGPIDALVLVLNFNTKADVTRASDPAAQL